MKDEDLFDDDFLKSFKNEEEFNDLYEYTL